MNTINQEQANKILITKPIKIKESGVFNDIHLSREERVEHARKILDSFSKK